MSYQIKRFQCVAYMEVLCQYLGLLQDSIFQTLFEIIWPMTMLKQRLWVWSYFWTYVYQCLFYSVETYFEEVESRWNLLEVSQAFIVPTLQRDAANTDIANATLQIKTHVTELPKPSNTHYAADSFQQDTVSLSGEKLIVHLHIWELGLQLGYQISHTFYIWHDG